MKEVPRNFLKKKINLTNRCDILLFLINLPALHCLICCLSNENVTGKKREAFPPYAVYAKIFAKDFNQIFISLGLELGS